VKKTRQSKNLERFFSKLKHFRAVAARFEKHSEKLPCSRQTRFSQKLDALYESVS
jgi:transposase